MRQHGDIIAIEREARRLATLHRTDEQIELDRQARERGHTDWEKYIDAQHPLVRATLDVRSEWLRPATKADGDVARWDVVPAFNPIADDALPADPEAREARVAALVSLLIWTSGPWGGQAPGTVPFALEMACAIVDNEIASARAQRRRPTLSKCWNAIATLEERVDEIGERNRKKRIEADAWITAFEEAAEAVENNDPRLSAAYRRMIEIHQDRGIDRIDTYGAITSVFRRFRVPGIAALVA
jgi:hypothetical protein